MTIELLSLQFGYNEFVLKQNTAGLTQADSLAQPRSAANCMNWVLGHILSSRNGVLKVLGREPIWQVREAERYARGSDPITDGADAVSFERMLADLEVSQRRILEGLQGLDPKRLSDPAPFSPSNREKETVVSLLAGLVFHEAYHSGQTGLIRRLIGKGGALK